MKKLAVFLVAMIATMTATAQDIKTLVVTPEPKMSCENCESTIKSALSSADGVESVVTSIDDQTITIKYDADKTSESKLTKALNKANYKVTKASSDCKALNTKKQSNPKIIRRRGQVNISDSTVKMCPARMLKDSAMTCKKTVVERQCCPKAACDTTKAAHCKAMTKGSCCEKKASCGQCDESKKACCKTEEATPVTTATQCKPNPDAKLRKE